MTRKNRNFTSQWKKFFLITGLFLALVLLLYFRFVLSRTSEVIQEKPLAVRAFPVVPQDLKMYDTVLGKVEGAQSVKVLSGASGFVVDMRKSLGDAVAEGEVIMVLEDSGTLYELRQAEGLFYSAQSDFEESGRKYEQYKRLFEKGVVSKDDLDSSKSALDRASSQLEAFEASYRKAKWYYDRLKIRSSLAGTVTEILPDIGQEVIQGETVARVTGNRINKVVAGVDSSIAKRTKRGAKVFVEYVASSGKQLAPGMVEGVSRENDDGSTTYSIEVSVDDEDLNEELWSGEFVNLRIESGELFDVVRVPILSLLYERGKPFVFVALEGKSRKVNLPDDLVWIDSETVAVPVSIFPQGALIINEGNSGLQEGQPVEILKAS